MTLLRQGDWTRWPTEVPSNPYYSVILWFCDSVILWFCDGFKLKDGRFRLDVRKKFLWWRWWDTGTDCAERWWMSHPWKHSRSGWTGLWATWRSRRCPCSLQGGWTRLTFKGPFQPKLFYHSVISLSTQSCSNKSCRDKFIPDEKSPGTNLHSGKLHHFIVTSMSVHQLSIPVNLRETLSKSQINI